MARTKVILTDQDKQKMKAFGKKVRELRLHKGISQEKLANIAQLHRNYIGAVERGEQNVSLININKIAKALNIESVDLFR